MHDARIVKAAVNVVYVAGLLFTVGATHSAAVFSVRKDEAAWRAHHGRRQHEVVSGRVS